MTPTDPGLEGVHYEKYKDGYAPTADVGLGMFTPPTANLGTRPTRRRSFEASKVTPRKIAHRPRRGLACWINCG
jgi:hypothetical protein